MLSDQIFPIPKPLLTSYSKTSFLNLSFLRFDYLTSLEQAARSISPVPMASGKGGNKGGVRSPACAAAREDRYIFPNSPYIAVSDF